MNPTNTRPKNWLVESILATIFCCMPLGIVGIINAASVNSRYDNGDIMGAEKASQEAAKWTKIAFFIGIASVVIWLIAVFVFDVGGAMLGGMEGMEAEGEY